MLLSLAAMQAAASSEAAEVATEIVMLLPPSMEPMAPALRQSLEQSGFRGIYVPCPEGACPTQVRVVVGQSARDLKKARYLFEFREPAEPELLKARRQVALGFALYWRRTTLNEPTLLMRGGAMANAPSMQFAADSSLGAIRNSVGGKLGDSLVRTRGRIGPDGNMWHTLKGAGTRELHAQVPLHNPTPVRLVVELALRESLELGVPQTRHVPEEPIIIDPGKGTTVRISLKEVDGLRPRWVTVRAWPIDEWVDVRAAAK